MGAVASNDLFLHFGMVLPMGQSDLRADDAAPKYRKGQLAYIMDDFGLRIFRYLHNQNGAVTKQGGLYSRAADVNVTLSAENPRVLSTKTLIYKAAAWTANALIGRKYVHLTNATSAGAAPEGEVGIVVANDANSISLDSGRPLSAVPSIGADTTRVISLFDFIASAANDTAAPASSQDAVAGTPTKQVMGIAMVAIADKNWGMLQTYGWCPDAMVKASTALGPGVLEAETEQLTLCRTTTLVRQKFAVAWVDYAITSSNATGFGTVFINVHSVPPPVFTL